MEIRPGLKAGELLRPMTARFVCWVDVGESPSFGGKRPLKSGTTIPLVGEVLSSEIGDGEYIGGTTSTTPNSNKTL